MLGQFRKRRYKVIGGILAGLGIVAAAVIALSLLGDRFTVLNTAGTVAAQERDLIVFTCILSLVVVVPVFVLLGWIAWHYRAGNKKASYRPDWEGSPLLETIWWGLPMMIIVILGVVIWTSSHALDPYRPLASNKPPLTIQVVALQWKWLFIYPEQDIATVNYFKIPVGTPVQFQITSDAPMNSFWIPQLGGQVYAMSGMSTQLHLMADQPGTYNGSSANISGKGFAGMKFQAIAVKDSSFREWVSDHQSQGELLGHETYSDLAKPSENVAPKTYRLSEPKLYDTIVMKYMGNGQDAHHHDDNTSTHSGAAE